MSRTATPDDVLEGKARWCVVEGDTEGVTLPRGSVDHVITDPPSGTGFVCAKWDTFRGRQHFSPWLQGILANARNATRDGGRSAVWSFPRTSHWTGCAVEDAGWWIETTITHLFAHGWPKDTSQLKPAAELWYLSRNGRAEDLNIDGCRVGTSKDVLASMSRTALQSYGDAQRAGQTMEDSGFDPNVGRYPANVVFSHAPGCVQAGSARIPGDARPGGGTRPGGFGKPGTPNGEGGPCGAGHAAPDGLETVDVWECVDGCPVKALNSQSGVLRSGHMKAGRKRGDLTSFSGRFSPSNTVDREVPESEGPASRYFTQFEHDPFVFKSRAPTSEKNLGVDEDNDHPTVKSVHLMRWLIRLLSAEKGRVIFDPFAGTGTTGVAALIEGQRVILVEKEPRYAEIARQRCEQYTLDLSRPVRAPARPKARRESEAQPSLFGGSKVPGDG